MSAFGNFASVEGLPLLQTRFLFVKPVELGEKRVCSISAIKVYGKSSCDDHANVGPTEYERYRQCFCIISIIRLVFVESLKSVNSVEILDMLNILYPL